jgi:antitoxin FitA
MLSLTALIALPTFLPMGTTLTIRNLDEDVKQKLRLRAASHQRSMEAEAREILAVSLAGSSLLLSNHGPAIAERRRRMEAVVGIWKDRYKGKSTDKIMKELRGDD